MKLDIKASVHNYAALEPLLVDVLNEIRVCVHNLERKVNHIMAILDPLAAEVTETKTIIESAVTLIEGIAAQLEEHKNEPAEIQRLADELNASSDALAAAVQANTPTP